jgi:hypothetical protein
MIEDGIYAPEVFAAVDVFDEVPIYMRLTQLKLLDVLSVAELNRELSLAGLRQLGRINAYVRAQRREDEVIRLLSITDWWVGNWRRHLHRRYDRKRHAESVDRKSRP